MIKIATTKKTISLSPALYNQAINNMRRLRLDNFSKYIRYLLTAQSDEVKLCRTIAREHLQLGNFYTELADGIEETKDMEALDKEVKA